MREPGLLMALHLRQVEVGGGSPFEALPRVMEEIEPEVEERSGDRLAVDRDVLLGKMPSARAHEERRDVLVQPVGLSLRTDVVELPADGVDQVGRPRYSVAPGRREGGFEIPHENTGTR